MIAAGDFFRCETRLRLSVVAGLSQVNTTSAGKDALFEVNHFPPQLEVFA